MKKYVLIALVLSGITASAQITENEAFSPKKELREKMKEWSPEQHAQHRTQQMRLHLDLTDAQQKEVYAIELAGAEKRAERREEDIIRKDMTPDELYSFKQQRLNEQIRIKEEFKQILSADQFEKWNKWHHRNLGKKPHRSRKNKG